MSLASGVRAQARQGSLGQSVTVSPLASASSVTAVITDQSLTGDSHSALESREYEISDQSLTLISLCLSLCLSLSLTLRVPSRVIDDKGFLSLSKVLW
jgi:hypothetical protein